MKVLKKHIKEIEEEIKHYQVKPRMANAMRKLGLNGFYFSGHGYSFIDGEEDFSFAINSNNRGYESGVHITLSNKNHIVLIYDDYYEKELEKKFKDNGFSKAVNYAIRMAKKHVHTSR